MNDLEYAQYQLLALLMDSENECIEDDRLDIELRVLAEHLHHFLVGCSCSTPAYDNFCDDPVTWARE